MRLLVSFLAAASVLAMTSAVWAQRDAASKIDGAAYEAPYFYDTADMYQQVAYEHARVLQGATSGGEQVPQAITKEHIAGIRSNVQAAQKHLTSLREKVKGNAVATKQLDELEAHHKKVLSLAGEIETASAGGKGDAATVNKHASAIAGELKTAHEKHQRTAQHLKASKSTGATSK